jgi:Fe-S oxidoreductase
MPDANPVFNTPFFQRLNQRTSGDNIIDCLTCGICISRCSWYDGEGGPNPRQMVRMAQLGLDNLLAESGMIWDCMICNHCTVACPMGIVMEEVVRKARSLPAARQRTPHDIQHGIETRLETGDVNGLSEEDFMDTIEWVNEEITDDLEDPKAAIPINQKGATYLYLPNPRELGTNVLHLQAMARLFYTFGEPWTMSHRHTDVTNWGYFVGDDEIERRMVLQVIEAAEALEAKNLVLSECGHGFHVLRERAAELIGRQPKFKVLSIVEVALEMFDKGLLKLDSSAHPYPVAYHDPCNLGRKSGVYEAPRRLLAQACQQVVELSPNRLNAICCGGGGGLLQDSTSTPRRMISGEAKADQIRATGAQHVATACLSCHRQLTEICKHYALDVKVDTVAAMVVEAMV